MKNIFIFIVLAITLSACGTNPPRPGPVQIVTVDKGVPSCPAPPTVPKYDFLVDKLAPVDASAPGKVAQSYVYDMTLARSLLRIQQMIIDEYAKVHQDFSKVQTEIDKLQVPAK